MKKTFLPALRELQRTLDAATDSPLTMFAKVVSLTVMNMRYEKMAFDRKLKSHPFILTRGIVEDALRMFRNMREAGFIEAQDKTVHGWKSRRKEEKHHQVFGALWAGYDAKQFEEYIRRYERRITVNRLQPLIAGKSCVDLGCGNGNFLFALLRHGAGRGVGVDFGAENISCARTYARHKRQGGRTRFVCSSIYRTGLPEGAFDFAIQNGVFHHLDDEGRAIREARRILKPGAWFWYYTDGEGGISYDLWDASVHMLRDVPVEFIAGVLERMNIDRNKVVHLLDGLQATYAHTSWKKITSRLARHGFGNFRRLTGGFPTDFDLDVIQADRYGRAKFGEGDLRILCQVIRK